MFKTEKQKPKKTTERLLTLTNACPDLENKRNKYSFSNKKLLNGGNTHEDRFNSLKQNSIRPHLHQSKTSLNTSETTKETVSLEKPRNSSFTYFTKEKPHGKKNSLSPVTCNSKVSSNQFYMQELLSSLSPDSLSYILNKTSDMYYSDEMLIDMLNSDDFIKDRLPSLLQDAGISCDDGSTNVNSNIFNFSPRYINELISNHGINTEDLLGNNDYYIKDTQRETVRRFSSYNGLRTSEPSVHTINTRKYSNLNPNENSPRFNKSKISLSQTQVEEIFLSRKKEDGNVLLNKKRKNSSSGTSSPNKYMKVKEIDMASCYKDSRNTSESFFNLD